MVLFVLYFNHGGPGPTSLGLSSTWTKPLQLWALESQVFLKPRPKLRKLLDVAWLKSVLWLLELLHAGRNDMECNTVYYYSTANHLPFDVNIIS